MNYQVMNPSNNASNNMNDDLKKIFIIIIDVICITNDCELLLYERRTVRVRADSKMYRYETSLADTRYWIPPDGWRWR